MSKYQKLKDYQTQLSNLSNLQSLIHWDSATNLAPGSAASRQKEMATLTAVIHEKSTSEEYAKLIDSADSELDKLSDIDKRNLQLIQKNFRASKLVSSDLVKKRSILCGETEFLWRTARAESNFGIIEKKFDELFEVTREYAKILGDGLGLDPYDALIDIYDPGRRKSELDNVYKQLKTELPKLVQDITSKQKDEELVEVPVVPEELQKQIGMRVMEKMGFDFNHGRLDKSVHPFCIGSDDDIRITTRYDENNFISGLYGIIHETGHALYHLNLPHEYRSQPVGQHMMMAFHESQSLIMELQACGSNEFCHFLSKLLRDEFNLDGKAFSAENIYRLITRVKPSFIRVEADEVTYPLHVILRVEIENMIINENLKAADLPELWNNKMQEYLGITPNNFANGCLQDIHWPSGSIGYFPSYSNGAIIAAMLMKKAVETNSDIMPNLKQGNFNSLNNYLNSSLRNKGCMMESKDLLKSGTGESAINPHIFLDYIKGKYL